MGEKWNICKIFNNKNLKKKVKLPKFLYLGKQCY